MACVNTHIYRYIVILHKEMKLKFFACRRQSSWQVSCVLLDRTTV